MKGFLAWLWHQHHWETTDRRERLSGDAVIGLVYILRCKDCGDIRYRSYP
jgi:hypothetical protein